MDGDEGKGMEVDEDGSVSVNVRIDARGDVVADEQVLVKGVTVVISCGVYYHALYQGSDFRIVCVISQILVYPLHTQSIVFCLILW